MAEGSAAEKNTSEIKRVTKAAGAMSAATMVSRLLGFVRDMLFAFFFGATAAMDAFLVAFRIPNLLRELFAEGSMSAALVPVMTETEEREGPRETERLGRVVFTFILSAIGGITALGILFAPEIVTAIAPGFLERPETFRTTVLLTRVMFPFLLFVSLSAFAMGSLNTRGVFFLPALAPAVLNVVTIVVVTLVARRVTPPVLSAAIGFSAGGCAQFLFQVPSFLKRGYSLRPLFAFAHRGLRTILRRMLPVVASMSTAQINIFVTNILASFLAAGSITYLFYAMRLIHLPIGVFGVAVSTAVLPSLTRLHVREDREGFVDTFSHALRLLFFLTIPAMAGLIVLREPIVATLFERGRWGPDGTAGTAEALLFYAAGIASMVGVRVLAATFYAVGETRTPVRVAVIGMASNIALSLLLIGPLRHGGLALANALAATVQALLLAYLLHRRLGPLRLRRTSAVIGRIILSAGAMAVPAFFVSRLTLWRIGPSGLRAAVLFLTIALCVLVYGLAARALGIQELRRVLELLSGKFSRGGEDGA